MAAMVERPISTLNDIQVPGPSIEIIDVDAFEDEGLNLISDLEEPSLTTFNPRPVPRPLDRGSRRTTPQTIYLLDSDDDDLVASSGSRVNPNTERPSNSGRILSPPPPNVPATMIPPVPPVPARFAGQTSFPMRLQPPPFPSPPVIRPSNRPFPFEADLDAPIAGPSNHWRRRRNDLPTLQAAPSSHHVPSMGLGGAIISSHRLGNTSEPSQITAGLTSGAATRQIRMPSFTSRLVDLARYSNFSLRQAPRSNVIMGDNPQMDELFGGDDGEGLFRSWRDTHYRRRQTGNQEQEQYLSSYTHPSQPDPGFTFDFAFPTSTADTHRRTRLFPPTSINNPIVLGDDDDDNGNGSSTPIAGPSSSSSSSSTSDTGQVTATLVCANCSDLLLINAALHPSQSDRRVWGLRCGHIIDEKCLNHLGQPPQTLNDSSDHGKGKSKATDSGGSYGDTIVSENQTVLEAIQENSIRSRLRSRPGSMASISSLLDLTPRLPPLKRRRVSKKKVEEEFLWRCPVANCGRVHVSVKVDGVWGPEKERESVGKIMGSTGQLEARGAIPIFA